MKTGAKNVHDVVVIGGGPAGIAAVTTAARQGLNCALLSASLGGRLKSASAVSNWPVQENISGDELAAQLARRLKGPGLGITVKQPAMTREIRSSGKTGAFPIYSVTTKTGEEFKTKSLILAMGASHKVLNLPGEEKLSGKGVSYCTTCDAPYFKNKVVAVLGEGRKAESAAKALSRIASKVYLLRRGKVATLRTDSVEVLVGVRPAAILGNDRVTGVSYRDDKTDEPKELGVAGVFIEAGSTPNSGPVKQLVKTDSEGQIIVDHKTMSTSAAGIFAAGDITDSPHKQAAIALAGGITAALSASEYVFKMKGKEK